MREVVQEIVATEGEAKLIVDRARAEADRILSEAQMKARDPVEQARQETLVEAEKIVEAAVKEAEGEKQVRLSHVAAEVEKEIRFDPDSRKRVVESIIRCVCKQP